MWEGGNFVFLLQDQPNFRPIAKSLDLITRVFLVTYILVVFDGGTKYQTFKIFLTENSGSLDWRIDYLSQEKLLSWTG